MNLKRLKKIIRPIYRKIFHHHKSIQSAAPPASCPFSGRPAGKEFSRYEEVKAILADDLSFHTSPCYDEVDPHHILLSAGGEAHDSMAKRLREYIATHKAGLEMQIAQIATDLLYSMPRYEPFDFRVEFCDAMAFKVMGSFYGLTEVELQAMADQVGILPHDEGFKDRLQPYMAQLLAKDERPESGLLATVKHWTKDEVIDQEEALFLLTLLWFAGIDTSTIALGRVMEFLLQNPHQWQELKGNIKNQLKFIEEVLRLKPPTTFIQRSVVKDVEVGGQMLQAGERIWLNILAANRDPEKFSKPDQLDLNSNHSKHLVFGYGMHQCIGMSLVRWETKALLQVGLPFMDNFQLLGDSEITVYGAPVEVNPITSLQVRFTPYAGSCPYHQEKNLIQVTSFKTAEQILKQSETFSTLEVYRNSDPYLTLLAANGDRHSLHTELIRVSLNRFRMPMEKVLRQHAGTLLAQLPTHQGIDFKKDVTDPFTLFAISELFGYTSEEEIELGSIQSEDQNDQTHLENIRLFLKKCLQRPERDKPGMLKDFSQHIAQGTISAEDASHIFLLMRRGGFESLSNLLSRLCQYLLENRQLIPQLLINKADKIKFIEETIRYSTTTAAIFREATADTMVNGTAFQKGDWIRLNLSKINRDPSHFKHPEKFQIETAPQGLLSFGKGPHQCIGMSMSRMEMRILLNELLPLIPHMQLQELEEKLYYGVEADLHAITRITVQLEQNPLQ